MLTEPAAAHGNATFWDGDSAETRTIPVCGDTRLRGLAGGPRASQWTVSGGSPMR